ncbi:MAG TPA: hypothetical protein VII56_14445 [Rhizomicrobium sp.]
MRPKSILEIAERATDKVGSFDRAVREFLDSWQTMPAASHGAALEGEPAPVGRVQDAYLAALAEHLALSDRIAVPEWTERASRFLSEPFFTGGLELLKATLLVESPLAFRRHLIFISADALSRPRRTMSEA